jgi:putative ABC transport system permease protein
MFWQTILMSIREIRRNLMRSILTILGIVIGVASVIIMVTLGSGATEKVTSYLGDLGTNLLMVRPSQAAFRSGARFESIMFKYADCTAIEREIDGISSVAPNVSRSVQVIYGNQNRPTSITGSTNGYITGQNWVISLGRSFTEGESHSGKTVCILGATVRDELFGAQNPVGESIRLQNASFRVIGVFEKKGSLAFGIGDQDDFILIPLKAFQRRIAGNDFVSGIIVSARNDASTEKVKGDIENLMRQRRKIKIDEEDDFEVTDMKDAVSMVTRVTGTLTLVLSAIAAISLLVGGIGIMNIMLVSVTERTREIGIRLAIGALERNVLTQFLVEAIVLSSFGGLLGMILGLSITALVSHFIEIPFVFSSGIVLIAFMFSAGVGIIFGFFPARKAARLDPIDALRHE